MTNFDLRVNQEGTEENSGPTVQKEIKSRLNKLA
jgi:hypothetical protein